MLPDISDFFFQRAETSPSLDGVAVPGLTARFFRREQDGRTATVGCYYLGDREILRAWGFVDEQHCRHHAVRDEHGWHPASDGCPEAEVITDGQDVVGLAVRVPSGEWVRRTAPADAPRATTRP